MCGQEPDHESSSLIRIFAGLAVGAILCFIALGVIAMVFK